MSSSPKRTKMETMEWEDCERAALQKAGYAVPAEIEVETEVFGDNFLCVSMKDKPWGTDFIGYVPLQYDGEDRNKPMFGGKRLIIMLTDLQIPDFALVETTMRADSLKRDVFSAIVRAYMDAWDHQAGKEWCGNALYSHTLEEIKFGEVDGAVVVFPQCST